MKSLCFRFIDFFWILIVILAITSSLESSVLVDGKTKKVFRYLLPQGWGFFTKSPREPQVAMYKIDNGKPQLVDYNNMSYKNLFGFSRVARIKGYELSIILEKVPKNKYVKGKITDIDQILKLEPIQLMPDEMINFTEKGTYIIRISNPIPWAWSNSNQENNVPGSFVKINVQ